MKPLFTWTALVLILFSCNNPEPASEKSETRADTSTESRSQRVEFADEKYAEIGRKGIADLSSGNIDGWMSEFADSAVYLWNSGDSIKGKAAITSYWKKRRGEVIESLTFANPIWLSVKVNQPQTVEQPGIWLMGWYETTAKYKSGRSMTQWIHTLMHFDNNDKIDRVIQFLDRAPINTAMGN